MDRDTLRDKAIRLRQKGKTYSDIEKCLGVHIPKATLYYWFRGVRLDKVIRNKIKNRIQLALETSRKRSLHIRKIERRKYLQALVEKNLYLTKTLENKDVAKIALAMLFLGEGSKNPKRGSLVFGNSDPRVIALFLRLLRMCYIIDKNKFRCTVQCRADQDIPALEKFWSKTTKIPPQQFYSARVDPRSIGKVSRKPEYRGVCRIDYFSANIFNELLKIIEVITKGR
jgi:hypothetical protein